MQINNETERNVNPHIYAHPVFLRVVCQGSSRQEEMTVPELGQLEKPACTKDTFKHSTHVKINSKLTVGLKNRAEPLNFWNETCCVMFLIFLTF